MLAFHASFAKLFNIFNGFIYWYVYMVCICDRIVFGFKFGTLIGLLLLRLEVFPSSIPFTSFEAWKACLLLAWPKQQYLSQIYRLKLSRYVGLPLSHINIILFSRLVLKIMRFLYFTTNLIVLSPCLKIMQSA